MLRNRQIAEEKRKAKIRETERLQNESLSTQDTMTTQETKENDTQTEVKTQRSGEKEKGTEKTKENDGEKSSETPTEKETGRITEIAKEGTEKDFEMAETGEEKEEIRIENDDSLSDEDMLHIAE